MIHDMERTQLLFSAALCLCTMVAAARGADAPTALTPLRVEGNQLVDGNGRTVWLQGLSLDSMQWKAEGDQLQKSIPVAVDEWHANAIRLAVIDDFWFGKHKTQVGNDTTGDAYRKR